MCGLFDKSSSSEEPEGGGLRRKAWAWAKKNILESDEDSSEKAGTSSTQDDGYVDSDTAGVGDQVGAGRHGWKGRPFEFEVGDTFPW